MSDSRVVGGLDRLPWLADEPVRKTLPAPRRRRDLTGWAAGAVVAVAAASFWLGSRNPVQEAPPPAASRPSATVAVPQPSPPTPEVRIAPQPQVVPTPQPQVRVIRVPEIRIVPAPAPKNSPSASEAAASTEAAPKAADASGKVSSSSSSSSSSDEAAERPQAAPLTPWQPRVVAGASGRLVQIGAFGSVPQAKQGWRYMVRAYPAVAHLPALVRPDRNSKGRVFYRFRVGTTSQAHSEVLCQRMQKIHLSCAVVGLPWKAKVER
jgi:outer membrane biosynthesis protein TonB